MSMAVEYPCTPAPTMHSSIRAESYMYKTPAYMRSGTILLDVLSNITLPYMHHLASDDYTE